MSEDYLEDQYFYFYPHTQFVSGRRGGVIHDLIAAKVFWFKNRRVVQAMSRLALRDTVDDAATSGQVSAEELRCYLALIHRLGLGNFAPQPVAVESYRPGLLRSKAEKHLLPRRGGTVTVEVSNACPFDCHFCTSKNAATLRACSCGVWETKESPLPLTDLLNAVSQVHVGGADRLVVQGGEPLSSPERLWPLLAHAKGRDMRIDLHATGFAIDREIAGRLAEFSAVVHLPIPATRGEAFDAAVGRLGAFDRVVNALTYLSDAGVPFIGKVPADPLAIECAYGTAEWALDRGASGIEFLWYAPPRSSAAELQSAMGAHGPDDMGVDLDEFISNAQSQACIDNATFISYVGWVSPCIGMRDGIADLRTEPFERVTRERLLTPIASMSRNTVDDCKACEFRMGCKGCLVRTLEINGSLAARHASCNYAPMHGEWTRHKPECVEPAAAA